MKNHKSLHFSSIQFSTMLTARLLVLLLLVSLATQGHPSPPEHVTPKTTLNISVRQLNSLCRGKPAAMCSCLYGTTALIIGPFQLPQLAACRPGSCWCPYAGSEGAEEEVLAPGVELLKSKELGKLDISARVHVLHPASTYNSCHVGLEYNEVA